jgi:hypothetical protein
VVDGSETLSAAILGALPADVSGVGGRCQGQAVGPERSEPRSCGLDSVPPGELPGHRLVLCDSGELNDSSALVSAVGAGEDASEASARSRRRRGRRPRP